MNYFFRIMFAACILFITGCGDSKEDLQLTTGYLKEGSWTGRFTNEDYSFGVAFLFVNYEYGTVVITEDDPIDYPFTYEVYDDGRILRLSPQGTIQLHGDWIVFEIGQDRLLLRQNHYAGNEGNRLEIKRVK